jgi:phosphoribosylpyrophosphate synthetase
MIILPTFQAQHIGGKLKKSYRSDFDFIYLGTNKDGKLDFPDREIYTTIEDIEKIDGEDIVVLHCGAPRPNSSTLRLYQTLDSLNNPWYSDGKKNIQGKFEKVFKPLSIRARSKKVFFLYFPYCMQDWPDKTGSTNAAKGILDICKDMYGVDMFFTIDAHFAGEDWIKEYPFVNVSAKNVLLEKAREKGYENPEVIGPDEGTLRRAGVEGMNKKRVNSRKSEMELPPEIIKKIRDRDVIVLDDVIETGGTLKKCGDYIREYVNKMGAAATHLRLKEGFVRNVSIYDDVIVANTIDTPYASVNVTDLVADTLFRHC